jgi:hypothetical protein
MESVGPQVRQCKKSFPSCISKRNPEAHLGFLFKNGNIVGAFYIHGYNSSPSSPTLSRGFVAFPEESAIWAPGENVQAARSKIMDPI